MIYRITFGICLLLAGFLLGCQDHLTRPDGAPNVSAALPLLPVKVTNTLGEWLVYDLHVHTPPGSTLQKIDVLQGDNVLLTNTDFAAKDNFYVAYNV